MANHRKHNPHTGGKRLFAVGSGALAAAGFGTFTAQAQSHDWSGVAQCESSGDWEINTGNGYYGGLQFSQSTWEAYKPAGAPERADLASQAQQIQAAEATLAVQGPGAWPVCGQYLTGGTTPDVPVAAPEPVPATQSSCDRVWPVEGEISSGYGSRWGSFHDGTDFAAPIGTPVVAVTSGTITIAGMNNDPGGYGNYIAQEADSGESVEYGHVSEIYVSPGQYVVAGETIAAVGNAGSSTGPHLHLRVSSGDPLAYLSGACDTDAVEPEVIPEVEYVPEDEPTPIADEIQAEIDNAPSPIYDELVTSLWLSNEDVVEDPDLIYPGEVLDLPDGSTHTVAPGDTLWGIAHR